MIKTKGLGTVTNPQVYAKLSLSDFKEAFADHGNYRTMLPLTRKKALEDDYKLIQAANKQKEGAK